MNILQRSQKRVTIHGKGKMNKVVPMLGHASRHEMYGGVEV